MSLLLLQIANTTADTASRLVDSLSNTAATTAPIEELRFGDLLLKGGWVMVPIGILAVLGLVIFFERFFTIRKASKDESNLMTQVRASIMSGNLQSAVAICRNSNS
ncbi:MAG: MotA/TolQ/ExbB proton channel family protein, partial [Sphingobacteriaceae bacterium]